MITVPLLLMLLSVKIINCQNLQIMNFHNQPIFILNKHPCKIQTGNYRIIHEINITDLETTINLLTKTAYNKIDNNLSSIVKHKIKNLYSNYNQIKPYNHRQARSLEIIGSTWKWIGGSPDAQDLRIINSKMNELVESNNLQYRFNERLGQKIKSLTNEMKKILESKTNTLIFNEIETLTTIINIDTINKILEEIQEAIALSKASITSNRILSSQEIKMIKNILEDQGVKINLPDEALSYVTPKIAVNNETLLYILRVPELQNEESKLLQIFPLNHNNSVIKDYPRFVVQHKKMLYSTTHPNEYVQQNSYLSTYSDDCIYQIIMGKSSRCIMQPDHSTNAEFISDSLLLINNAKGHDLASDCGPDNQTLNGNFLVTFTNCSIHFDQQTFTSKETTLQTPLLYGPMYNKDITRQLSENDLASLDNRTLINRKKIQHMDIQQSKIIIWNWSLLSGIVLSTLINLTIIVFAFLYLSHLVQHIMTKLKKRRNRPPGQNLESSNKDMNA